ncbi:MAG: hypothetical protein Q8L46_02410, partial [candidate division WWE3 bacterium]|nr:hypothetical protein [candidate division WWE3 bacterium]
MKAPDSPPALSSPDSLVAAAIIKTLCYHDLFDCPLTVEEVAEFLIGQPAHFSQVEQVLAQMVAEGKVGQIDGYHFL